MDRERGPVAWPPRSPDLTPLDFFLRRHVKSVVYINPVNTRQELIERIFTALIKSDTVLACSPDSDRQWHDDVMSVIRYRTHTLNTSCNFFPTCRIKMKS